MTGKAGVRIGGALVSHDQAREAAEHVLGFEGVDDIEVVVSCSSTGLTRYANSQIIQNTSRDEVRAYVRVALGDRFASAATNQLAPRHLEAAATRALEAARASRPDPDFPGLPDPDALGRPESVMRWSEPTSAATPSDRAGAVSTILHVTGDGDAAGIFETSSHCFGVFSSKGVDCYDAYTRCVVTCLVDVGGATGWGEGSSHDIGDVDVEVAARRALEKARASKDATDAQPGTYEVVLEPPAVGTMLDYFSYVGMGAKKVVEGESWLASRAGETVAVPAITVADDARHPRSVGIGFDFEGVPKKRVAVIDGGRATGPVTDVRYARKLGVEPSGHYSGSGEFGPWAANVVLEAGDKTLDDLVAGVEDGFLVTRFHYVNVLDWPATLLTGMTRDGTFRISGGEIAGAVHNFRFTQSVLDALANVAAVGRDQEAFAPEFSSFGSTVAPALHVSEFRFSSTTSH